MVRRGFLNKGEMTLEEAVRVLDLCKEYRDNNELETMDLLGGEPLLWPHLKDYISILLERGTKPWVFTNMVSITKELATWLYEREVHITGKLNIANPADQEQLYLQGEMIGADDKAARKMMNAVDVFLEAGYRDPLFRLQNLVRKKNIHLIPGYICFCRSRGIGVDIELMGSGESIGPEYYEVAPTAEELAELVRELDRRGKSYMQSSAVAEIEGCYPEFANPVDKLLMPHLFGSCPFYDKGLYFAVDGSIRACSNSTTVLAHVNDPEPIRNAYDSHLIHCRRVLTKDRVGEPCRSCDRWDRCRGGCRATVEGMGDPRGGYKLCPLPILQGKDSSE